MVAQQKILRVFRLINYLKSKPGYTVLQLAQKLEVSKRSMFRYFNLLEELGFEIDYDLDGRYFIASNFEDLENITFDMNESVLIKEALSVVSESNQLKGNILKKLSFYSEQSQVANNLLEVGNNKKIQVFSQAIKEKKRVVLLNYHSLHSGVISDRVLEPFSISDNYTYIHAIDIRNPEIRKKFKLSRVDQVELVEEKQRYTKGEERIQIDPFGFSGDQLTALELHLKLRSLILLREQYPNIKSYVKQIDQKNELYQLKVDVYNLEPIKRFVLSQLDEVKIIQPNELRNEIFDFISKYSKEI